MYNIYIYIIRNRVIASKSRNPNGPVQPFGRVSNELCDPFGFFPNELCNPFGFPFFLYLVRCLAECATQNDFSERSCEGDCVKKLLRRAASARLMSRRGAPQCCWAATAASPSSGGRLRVECLPRGNVNLAPVVLWLHGVGHTTTFPPHPPFHPQWQPHPESELAHHGSESPHRAAEVPNRASLSPSPPFPFPFPPFPFPLSNNL